jgi:DNA-binding PadR family transcriptional regulator
MAATNVQMFILGNLTQGEAHGYQLLARARMWGVEDWAGFGAGSIYNALATLEKKGLVVRSGTERHGGYAPATIYAITDAGREALRDLLHAAAASAAIHDPFDLVTPFLGLLPLDERRQLIQAHIAALERRLADGDGHQAHVQRHVDDGKPLEWVLAAMEKNRRFNEEAAASARELLERSASWQPPEPLPRGDCARAGDHDPCGRADERRAEGDGNHRQQTEESNE